MTDLSWQQQGLSQYAQNRAGSRALQSPPGLRLAPPEAQDPGFPSALFML